MSLNRPLTVLALGIIFAGTSVQAATIQWVDWQTSSTEGVFTAGGTITTPSASVGVTYNNPQGVSVYQTGTGTDYFQNYGGGRDAADSPFTSAEVENIPTAAEMIALYQAGDQTLTFSETVANLVFSYISLNGNGYAFDQDFEILSFGHSSNGNDCGFWGCGTSYKSIVDLGGGNFEYQLLGTGEPHGTIRFLGAFDDVSWRSLSNENWNGFTVGVEGTEAEVLPTPPTFILLLVGVIALRIRRARVGNAQLSSS